MGMFTSVLHPKDGRELQIKSGFDDCDTYKLGDTVDWFVSSYPFSGKLFDGVYSSYSDLGPDDWVIIKNHVVVAVEDKELDYDKLYEKYGIQEPPRDLWSAEALETYDKHQAELEARRVDFKKRCEGKSSREIMVMALVEGLRGFRRLDYTSVARKIFVVEPMPEAAQPIYMKDDSE